MKLNARTLAVSILSSGLIALGSSIAIAENIDNTSPGESGHGTGCSNHVGGCYAPQESSTFGSYQQTSEPAGMSTGSSTSTGTMINPDNTTPGESGHGTGASAPESNCLPASEATPGHCISGGTNN